MFLIRARLAAPAALALGLGFALAGSGCSECEQLERCRDDSTVELCLEPEPGDARRSTFRCEDPNSRCVEVDDGLTECVYPPGEGCPEGFVDHCEGEVRVYCQETRGQLMGVDCVGLGLACGIDPATGRAACLPPG